MNVMGGGGVCRVRTWTTHGPKLIVRQVQKYYEDYFFPTVRFHGNGGHIRFEGTHQGT